MQFTGRARFLHCRSVVSSHQEYDELCELLPELASKAKPPERKE